MSLHIHICCIMCIGLLLLVYIMCVCVIFQEDINYPRLWINKREFSNSNSNQLLKIFLYLQLFVFATASSSSFSFSTYFLMVVVVVSKRYFMELFAFSLLINIFGHADKLETFVFRLYAKIFSPNKWL